jgi:hypothetical protein
MQKSDIRKLRENINQMKMKAVREIELIILLH